MFTEAERMFWEQKAETLRRKHLDQMGDPEQYERFCAVIINRMMGNYKITKKIKHGRIEYKWQRQSNN